MKVLVTGAAGFIGSHLAAALLARGDTVVGLDNFNDYYDPQRKRDNAATLVSNPRFILEEVDVRDEHALIRICQQHSFDAVAHLAAMAGVRYSISRAQLYVDVNIRGTVNILDAVQETGIGHVVFASTSSVYGSSTEVPFQEDSTLGRPLAPYPATKISGELMGYAYHNLFDTSFTAVRFFAIIYYTPVAAKWLAVRGAHRAVSYQQRDSSLGGQLTRLRCPAFRTVPSMVGISVLKHLSKVLLPLIASAGHLSAASV